MVDPARAPVLTPVTDAPLLRLDSVSKTWGQRVVLDDVTLALQPRTLTWLAGANGVGKTTLLRIAAGLLGPDGGGVSLDGLHPRSQSPRIPEAAGLSLRRRSRHLRAPRGAPPPRTVGTPGPDAPDAEVRPAIERICDLVGLEALLPLRADRISMGQRQRLRTRNDIPPLSRRRAAGRAAQFPRRGRGATSSDAASTTSWRAGVVLWCSPGPDGDHRGL